MEKVTHSCDTISHTCLGSIALWRCGENFVVVQERAARAGSVAMVSEHGIYGIKIDVLIGHGVDQLDLFQVIGADLGHVLTQE